MVAEPRGGDDVSEDEKVKIALEFIETHAKLRAIVRRAVGEIAYDALMKRDAQTTAEFGAFFPEMVAMNARLLELRDSWEIVNGRAT